MHIKKFVAVFALQASLFSAGANAQAVKSGSNSSLAQKIIKDRLLDPYSVRFEGLSTKAGKDRLGKVEPLVCGSYNAKNKFGAYIGAKKFVYVPSEKAVFTVKIEKFLADGSSITSDAVMENAKGDIRKLLAAQKTLNEVAKDVEFWLLQCA